MLNDKKKKTKTKQTKLSITWCAVFRSLLQFAFVCFTSLDLMKLFWNIIIVADFGRFAVYYIVSMFWFFLETELIDDKLVELNTVLYKILYFDSSKNSDL